MPLKLWERLIAFILILTLLFNTCSNYPVYDKAALRWVESSAIPDPAISADTFACSTPPNAFIVARASDMYNACTFKRWVAGDLYREVWETPFTFRVIDLSTEKGGLRPLEKGGGMQTSSLVLEANDGSHFVLRSVQKDISGWLPLYLRNTSLHRLLQDGIASENPYAAIVIPPLADAVGVRHNSPEYVWLGNDPALGEYSAGYANRLYLFEEKLRGSWTDTASCRTGFTNTVQLLKCLQQYPDISIDTTALMRARLLDILIGDWDRHSGQWSWAAEERDGKTVFVPVPHDRDQAFFRVDGWLYRMVAGKLLVRRLSDFGPDVDDLEGLVSNGHSFDLLFLKDITADKWKTVAAEMQHSLTDSVIDSAVQRWPKSLFSMVGEPTADGLKKRRQNLIRYAEEYSYLLNPHN